MSDETTLLPCPFCGGEAELTTFGFSWEPLVYGVRCIADAKRGFDAHGHQIAGFGSAEKAIAAWNSRAERTCEWELEHSGTLYDKWRCSKCGYLFVESRTDQGIKEDFEPNFCPVCGKSVKR